MQVVHLTLNCPEKIFVVFYSGCFCASHVFWCCSDLPQISVNFSAGPRANYHESLTFNTDESKSCPSDGGPDKLKDEQGKSIDATLRRIMNEELYNLLAALTTKVEQMLSPGKQIRLGF